MGDKVKVRFGVRSTVATVIEDRGSLGHRGEQVVRVEVPIDETESVEIEVAASSATLVQKAPPRRAAS